jgi:molybdopterin-guanine dinucleotide biosynthesis protein A
VIVDAIVLTGGRSSRLGSVPKAELRYNGQSLLQRSLVAVTDARLRVVVGAPPTEPLPEGVTLTRENPAFGGPAAGIGAGVEALARRCLETSRPSSDVTIVLACDMPHSARIMPFLYETLKNNPDSDGVISVDADGRLQFLAAAYRTAALTAAITTRGDAGMLRNLPVHRLVQELRLVRVSVPADATADVDTWEDGQRLGVSSPQASTPSPRQSSEHPTPPTTTEGAP